MAIEQLGESLLSQARDRKKKEKKKAKLFAGVLLGVQAGNIALRKRAERRANEFWKSNQGLINQRANQFDTGVNFFKDHNAMIKTYGESLDKETGENWVSAFNSSKLKQYQTSPEYSDLYKNNPQEFNKLVNPLLENDRQAYRVKVAAYSDFKNITSADKETKAAYKAAYEKPLRDKLQKAVDIINRQDSVGGWLFNKVGIGPSAELVPLKDKDGKAIKDIKGNVTMIPAGLGDKTKASLITSITNTVDNWNKIQSAVGVKEKFTSLQLQSLVPKPKVIELSVEPDKEFKDIFSAAWTGESNNENLKQEDFIVSFGEGTITVSEFLNEFEIKQGDKTETNNYLTDAQKQNVYTDALKLANYRYTLQAAQGKKTGLGSLQLPDGGKKKYFNDALQEIIAGDFEVEIGQDGFLGFGSDEPRGVYNRKTMSSFISSVLDKDVITIPDKNNKPVTVPQEVIDEVFTDEVLVSESNKVNELTTPNEVINEFKTVYLNDPNFNNASGEIKAGVIKGILIKYPEMSSALSTMFVDIYTQQDMMQRGQVDDSKVTDMKQRGPVDDTKASTFKSILEMDEDEIMRSEAADKASSQTLPALAKIIGVDKESVKNREIKKTENFISGESMLLPFTFSKWLKETKEIQSSNINKEDKIKYAKEFLEFLNQ